MKVYSYGVYTPKWTGATVAIGKCDARRCGSPAELTTKFGARYCRGHAYLVAPAPQEASDKKPSDAGEAQT